MNHLRFLQASARDLVEEASHFFWVYIYVQIFKIQTGREKGGGAGRDGDTKDLCETTFYAYNITIHRTRRQAVQHKTHSNRPDSI